MDTLQYLESFLVSVGLILILFSIDTYTSIHAKVKAGSFEFSFDKFKNVTLDFSLHAVLLLGAYTIDYFLIKNGAYDFIGEFVNIPVNLRFAWVALVLIFFFYKAGKKYKLITGINAIDKIQEKIKI